MAHRSLLLLACALLARPGTASSPAAASLPAVFYWNAQSRTIQTTRPAEMLTWSAEYERYYMHGPDGAVTWDVPRHLLWQRVNGSDGKTFYYNEALNVSVWSKPKALAWEELPAERLPTYLAELHAEERSRRSLVVFVSLLLLCFLVWAVRWQYRGARAFGTACFDPRI